jgi:glyoxylase-like metal-dependent hydrolase (beta-lactamase superfamily II)
VSHHEIVQTLEVRMLTFNRRKFVLSAATAGAAFGLSKPLEIVASAHAQTTDKSPMNPNGAGFHKFKVGDMEVTTIFDGAISRDHSPAFINNASIEDVKAALRKANLPDDKVPNTYTITVVKVGGRTIMFDSGNGPAGAAGTGQLTENIKAAGIDPASITTIAVTHFHPDHIFGLMTKENAQIYGNVEIVVPDTEYAFWSDPAVVEKLAEARRGIARRVQATMPAWKNLKMVSADKDVIPGVRAVATNGHSPGHTSYLVGTGSAQLLVLGDVTNIPAINMANPGWHVMFDQDAAQAEATRRRMFDRAITDKLVCTGYHWGMPGAGTIAKDGNGYALVPVA